MREVTGRKKYAKVVAGLIACGMLLAAGAAQAIPTSPFEPGLLGITAGPMPDIFAVGLSFSGSTPDHLVANGAALFFQTPDPNLIADDFFTGPGSFSLDVQLVPFGHGALGQVSITGNVLSDSLIPGPSLLLGTVTRYGHQGSDYDFSFMVDPTSALAQFYGPRGGIMLHLGNGTADIIPGAPVPEPATMSLLLSGCGALAALRRRQKPQAS